MKQKIPAHQLRLGMHIHEFCGSWMSHPFWRAKFTLNSADDLKKILDGGVTELWIDTDKGNGVEDLSTSTAVAVAVASAAAAAVAAVELPAPEPELSQSVAQPSHEAALGQAAALCRRSLPKIAALFGEARLGKAVDTAACGTLVDEISDSVLQNPGALISIARLKRRDEYTFMHSVAVCALMLALGRQLGLQGEELKQAGLAGLLHDLGKALIPLEILNKPAKLTEAELTVMRGHAMRGFELLSEGGAVGALVLDVCLHHHEKMDGSGYPEGLPGDQISLIAKMGAVCDVYDAVTSARPYKDGWDPGEAVLKMAQWKGHFDPHVFRAFATAIGIYPIGSLVRLSSGRLAVVLSHNPAALMSPAVKVFFSIKSDMWIDPYVLDLARQGCPDKIVASEAPSDWSFRGLEQLWGAPPARASV